MTTHVDRFEGPRPQVLVADDDRELRRLLATALRAIGFVVTEAATGLELLDHVAQRQQGFDLIITDIRMPGLSGLSVVEGLRGDFGHWTTPIIVITAFGDRHVHAEADRLGVVMLDKPFDIDDLRACATRLVA